jgi:PIN domain nuclease of toxin-antitoxin system
VNLLLDTHVLIWWIENNRRLGKRARAEIQNNDAAIWISSATIWEISIKAAIGRLDVHPSFENALRLEIENSGFQSLPVTFDHAFAVRHLPLHHTDPFDRMLIAQAQCEGLTLLTVDSQFADYGVPTLDASK